MALTLPENPRWLSLLIGETKKSFFFRKYIKNGHLDRIKGTESQKFQHKELLKLIDVKACRVAFAKPRTEYATLSYVWGQTQQFRMTKNLAISQEDKKERFITLPEHWPKTIEDAEMHLVDENSLKALPMPASLKHEELLFCIRRR
jgi:hypothetical protein